MTTALEAFQEALAAGADDDALDMAAADVRRDSGPAALVEAIRMRIARDLGVGKTDLDVTALRFRLAAALEEVARASSTDVSEGARAALEAAGLYRDVLNDGDATIRNVVIALKLGSNDDAALKRAIEIAGNRENAETLVEKALKKPDVKEDANATAMLRRALSRVAEHGGDKERAFFEGLKAARKKPSEGLYVDEVFRLALETTRYTEAAAFFGALADDESLAARQRATLYNKLGQTLEMQTAEPNAKRLALEAYTKSLRLHEAKAAKRAAQRLAAELGVDVPEQSIRADEPVEVTPPFDHKKGTVTTEQEAIKLAAKSPAPEQADARTDRDLPTRAQASAPAEVTMPRALPPLTSETAEVPRPELAPLGSETARAAVAPSSSSWSSPPAADTLREIGSPPVPNTSSSFSAGEMRPFSSQGSSPWSSPGGADAVRAAAAALAAASSALSGDPLAAKHTERAATAPAGGALSSDAQTLRAIPAPHAPIPVAPVASEPAHLDDGAAPQPNKPRPISVPPGAPASIAASSAQSNDDRIDERFAIANLPSFDDEPELTPSESKPDLQRAVDAIVAEHARAATNRGAAASDDGDDDEHLSRSIPPATATMAEAWQAKESSPFTANAVEDALARMPARNENRDEPTKRGPHATITAVNSGEHTAEHLPGKKNSSGEKKKSRKERKREKTQKKKLTAIQPPAKALLVSSGSIADGNPVMPAPDAPAPDVAHTPAPPSLSRPPSHASSAAALPSAPSPNAPTAAGGIEGIEVEARPVPASSSPHAPIDAHEAHESSSTDPEARRIDVALTDAEPDPAARFRVAPHTLQPPSDEITGQRPSREQPATLEAMAPLAMPPLTVPEMEASTALTRALAALEGNDADECTRAALELAKDLPTDPRVLRLAARAMSLSAPSGQMPKDAVELFVAHAAKHGDRAAGLAVEVHDALPAATRRAYTHLWLAAARAAGLDVRRVMELLRDVAVEDAPNGPAFEHAERVLVEVNDATARDGLYQAALRAATDDGARAELTKRRIGLLENQSRFGDALVLHAQLAVDLASADVAARSAARRAHAQHGAPDERARFLGKLARKLPGDEGVDVVQELLDVRLSVDDRIGAEAAARDLLARKPGDSRATRVLADLLEDDAGRIDELVEVLRVGAQQALSWFGKTGEARTLLERLAGALAKAGRNEDAADAWVQVARVVPDERNVERALAALDDVKRHKEAVALLEETASAVADDAFRARVLLRAAEIAKAKLQKRGKARELVERALELVPRDRASLRAYAELLVEIGDAQSAIDALERLAAEVPMSSPDGAKERAIIQLRIGRLVEEHLLKPDDALKRYRAAAEMDAHNADAWSAIRAIARPRGDRALLVEALKGLAGATDDAHEKASLWRQIAKVERDERVDTAAAERAFAEALAIESVDVESLMGLAALVAARLQPDVDFEASLAQPNDALLDAMRAHVVAVPASELARLPLALRRLHAIALSRSGDRSNALARFEDILSEQPEDLGTLMALARHLASSSSGGAPRGETGSEARRLRALETILLHHAYALKPPVQVDVWGEVAALRAATGDGTGARKAAKKVMALATTDDLRACLSDRAVRAVALALDDARDAERDGKAIIAALKLDADRSFVEAEKSRLLERAASIAFDELKDRVLARALLEDSVRANPASQSAREALLDLDVQAGDVAGALKQVRDLLTKESDPKRKALLHLRLFRLRKKVGLDLDGAAAELKNAVEQDPGNAEILDAAEQFFTERNDTDGLDKLWSAQLRALDRGDLRARLKLLERLAQLRRYERRDLAGAIEALEAMTAIDPEALKPREDVARLYTELGLAKEAVSAWRGVLERDPLQSEAWRGIFARFAATRQGDETFAVASTMAALELADDDVTRAVRTIRPPFPRWPIPPKDPLLFRRKVAHPLERTPIRAILDVTAARLLPLYARRLKDFGFHKRDALADKNVPTSVLLAVRTLAQLLGLKETPSLFLAELGSTDQQPPPFAVLPSTEPGIIVTNDVIKGGMTPERAFALGRAASWLQPHAVMSAAVDTTTLRAILEALVSAFLGAKNLERADLELEKLGKDLAHSLTAGADESALKAELLPALRDYVHARQQVQVADWRAGVGYTGDRVGFLMATDLNAAFRMIKATAGTQSIGARLAIKELVLFSVSSGYLGLRKDLGLALPELAASPLLDLG